MGVTRNGLASAALLFAILAVPAASALHVQVMGVDVRVLETYSNSSATYTESGVTYGLVVLLVGEQATGGACSGAKRYYVAGTVTYLAVAYGTTSAWSGCPSGSAQAVMLNYCLAGCGGAAVYEASPGSTFSPTSGVVGAGGSNAVSSFGYEADKSASHAEGTDYFVVTSGDLDADPAARGIHLRRVVSPLLQGFTVEADSGACSGPLNVLAVEVTTWGLVNGVTPVCA